MRPSYVFIGLFLSLVLAGNAAAQTPQRTTATYGDWIVRCETGGPVQVCEMTQSTQLKGQSQPITQIAIHRQGKDGPWKVALQVPVNVWLAAGVKITSDDGHTQLSAGFSRCVPAGCIADSELKETAIATLRALTTNGKLQFKAANEKDVAVPVSFKGFGDAYDAMQK